MSVSALGVSWEMFNLCYLTFQQPPTSPRPEPVDRTDPSDEFSSETSGEIESDVKTYEDYVKFCAKAGRAPGPPPGRRTRVKVRTPGASEQSHDDAEDVQSEDK